MIIMSIDLGKARTGLAVCDKEEILASPLCVIQEWNTEKLAAKVAAKSKEVNSQKIVLGLPKNMDGSEGESAINARNFAELLSKLTDVPIEFQDERCTTITAHTYLNETNTRGKKRKSVIDAVAATIILEDYLRKSNNAKSL